MSGLRRRLIFSSLAGSIAGLVVLVLTRGLGLPAEGWIWALPAALVTGAASAAGVYVAASWQAAELRRLTGEVSRQAQDPSPPGARFGTGGTSVSGDELDDLAEACNLLARRLQEQRWESAAEQERFQAILTQMDAGVLFIDGRGTLLFANRAAGRMLGLPPSDVGLSHVEAIRDFQISEAVDQAFQDRKGFRTELQLIHAGQRWVEASIVVLGESDALAGVVVVLHDLTSRRRVERLRSEFIANVSHELRTPVTAITGFAETLLEGTDEDPETSRRFIGFIVQEAQRLNRLVEDLLELVRFEERQVSLVRREVNLAEVLREAADRFRPAAGRMGLAMELALPVRPVYAYLDADRVEQVVVNLVDNAFKYTPAGGSVSLGLERREDGALVISVRDTGQGMPKDEVEMIFERFYRLDKGRSRRTGGTGLGLAIVRQIVEAHGGRVWAESEPGKGSTFFVALPRWEPRKPEQADAVATGRRDENDGTAEPEAGRGEAAR